MSESEVGTFSKLMEMGKQPQAPRRLSKHVPPKVQADREDLSTTPYHSQNYRFTEDELEWLRERSFALSAHFGVKVSQNTVVRFAIRFLRDTTNAAPDDNPLLRAIEKLGK